MRKLATGQPLLDVNHLSISAVHQGNSHKITEDISFDIHIGETLSIVGESGSGKSVTASAVAGLLTKPLIITHGQIVFQGINLLETSAGYVKSLRGKDIGCVFQDYRGSLTPFLKVGHQLVEVIRTHTRATRAEAKEMTLDWLHRVKLPAERSFRSYPFQLSGGQLQRVALAAALMLKPSLLIADEPITALDVITGQAIMDLMEELQCEVGCAILLISHDLRQVLKRSHRIAVMQEGHLVETGSRDKIKNAPHHPYTQALLKACPRIPRKQHTSPEVMDVWG